MYSSTHSYPQHQMEVSAKVHAPVASPRKKSRGYSLKRKQCGQTLRRGGKSLAIKEKPSRYRNEYGFIFQSNTFKDRNVKLL